MDRLIDVRVNGSTITKDHNCAGAQYESGSTCLRITFAENWDNCAKTVTFWNATGTASVKRLLTTDLLEDAAVDTRVYVVPIPGEAMTDAGWNSFVIDGYINSMRRRTVADRLKVLPSKRADDAGDPVDPTPTQAEQLQKQIDAIIGDIQLAAEAAGSAERAEESASAAEASETAAAGSAAAALASEQDAEAAATSATESAQHAADSEHNARLYAESAEQDAVTAQEAATRSAASEAAAQIARQNAGKSAEDASGYATMAESYARGGTETRDGENADNARAYAAQAKQYAETARAISGGDFATRPEVENMGEIYHTQDIPVSERAYLWLEELKPTGEVPAASSSAEEAAKYAAQAEAAAKVAAEYAKLLGNAVASAAKISTVTLLADAWTGDNNIYGQVVSIEGVTEHSQVDLTPSIEQLAVFYEKDVTFVTENEDGVVTVYAIGQKPENDYVIQVTITEASR